MGTNQRAQITMTDDEVAAFVEAEPHGHHGDGRSHRDAPTSWPCGTP